MVEQTQIPKTTNIENPIIPTGESARVNTEGLEGFVQGVHEDQHVENIQAAHPEGNVIPTKTAVPPPTQLSDVRIEKITSNWESKEAKALPVTSGSRWGKVLEWKNRRLKFSRKAA